MNSVERYVELLQTALEIQQSQIELSRLYSKLSDVMTVKELTKKVFSSDTAGKAFKLLDGVKVEETTHVKTRLLYKDVELYLHEDINNLGEKAMKNCLIEVSSKRLLG